MTYTPDSRIKKLPMWAQNEFGSLQRINAELLAQNAALTAGPEESDTIADPKIHMMRDGRTARPLGNGTEVEFLLSDMGDDHIDVKIVDSNGRRVLQITGGYALNIEVQASNILHVYNRDRHAEIFRGK